MDTEKLQQTANQKLETDYLNLQKKWQSSKPEQLVEDAQFIYIAKEVHKELDYFDFETIKYVINAENVIENVARKHIDDYEMPTQDSVYAALWDLVDESINIRLASDENAVVNEENPTLRTIRDMVVQFPECDFDLMGAREYISFTAEQGQQMLQGVPLQQCNKAVLSYSTTLQKTMPPLLKSIMATIFRCWISAILHAPTAIIFCIS